MQGKIGHGGVSGVKNNKPINIMKRKIDHLVIIWKLKRYIHIIRTSVYTFL